MFDPTDQAHVGKSVAWHVYSIRFTGRIARVYSEKRGVMEPGDWLVDSDHGTQAILVGSEEYLTDTNQVADNGHQPMSGRVRCPATIFNPIGHQP